MNQVKIIKTSRRVFLEKKDLVIPKDNVIISITNPKEREARLDHLGCQVYRFPFDDYEEVSEFFPNLITADQANDILNILENNNKIIVHCEMAFSRSPAVAIFARNKLGFTWINETWDCIPNKLVYQTLLKQYELRNS